MYLRVVLVVAGELGPQCAHVGAKGLGADGAAGRGPQLVREAAEGHGEAAAEAQAVGGIDVRQVLLRQEVAGQRLGVQQRLHGRVEVAGVAEVLQPGAALVQAEAQGPRVRAVDDGAVHGRGGRSGRLRARLLLRLQQRMQAQARPGAVHQARLHQQPLPLLQLQLGQRARLWLQRPLLAPLRRRVVPQTQVRHVRPRARFPFRRTDTGTATPRATEDWRLGQFGRGRCRGGRVVLPPPMAARGSTSDGSGGGVRGGGREVQAHKLSQQRAHGGRARHQDLALTPAAPAPRDGPVLDRAAAVIARHEQ